MNAETTVRPMLPQESVFAAKLERDVFSDPWSEEALSDMICSENHVILCAVSSDRGLLGYMAASCVAGESEVLRIAASPDIRRRGIGSMMLDHFINERISANDTTVFLEVRASNNPAVSLYRSRGFNEYAVRRNYYKNPTEDALMMRLDLVK